MKVLRFIALYILIIVAFPAFAQLGIPAGWKIDAAVEAASNQDIDITANDIDMTRGDTLQPLCCKNRTELRLKNKQRVHAYSTGRLGIHHAGKDVPSQRTSRAFGLRTSQRFICQNGG